MKNVPRVAQVAQVPQGVCSAIIKLVDKSEKSYHKLIVWQKHRDLLLLTYELTNTLPKSELFGLRRAAVSVVSNFVEGYLKKSKKEKVHFMEIAATSLLELEAQSEICLILQYWTEEDYKQFDKARAEAAYFLFKYTSKISE